MTEQGPPSGGRSQDDGPGQNKWWRRAELHRCPKACQQGLLRAYPSFWFRCGGPSKARSRRAEPLLFPQPAEAPRPEVSYVFDALIRSHRRSPGGRAALGGYSQIVIGFCVGSRRFTSLRGARLAIPAHTTPVETSSPPQRDVVFIGTCPIIVHYSRRCRISRAISRSVSRLAIASRLSYWRLPRARASSTLALPLCQ